ncbi:MAG: hypothetical protein AAFR46_03865 [Pseudomonadota bacterium]
MTQATKLLLPILALVLLFAVPRPLMAQSASYQATCVYFTNIAFQDSRTVQHPTFRMEIAEDCADALRTLRDPLPEARSRAEAYLKRLQAYRAALTQILLARLADRHARKDRRLTRYARPVITPVSRAGAYLIARQMGIVASHADWVAWRMSEARAAR